MIKFRSSAAVATESGELFSFDISGPADENKNGKPDVHVTFSALGVQFINGPVDFPLDAAISAIVALGSVVASHLPFPVRLPGLPKS